MLDNIKARQEHFSSPQIVPFAVLNHQLNPEGMRDWIKELAQAGIDGVFLHPRIGLLTPYLSEAWFEAIHACIEAARDAGIKVWLYDEFPYPSGAAGGKVLAEHPEYIEQYLEIISIPFTQAPLEIAYLEDGPIIEAFLIKRNSGGGIVESLRVTQQIGSVNDEWIRTDWDSRFYYDPRDTMLFRCPRSDSLNPMYYLDGKFDASWEELLFFRKKSGSSHAEPFGHYIDVSSANATRKFLQTTHEQYFSRFGNDFGTLIPGIFTDEPKYRNFLPWSQTIAAQWAPYQEDPAALLALADPSTESLPIRQSYRETCGELFKANWCEIVSSWCQEHQLKLCGHISPEEQWYIEHALCGSILSALRAFQIPGCDLIIPAVGDGRNRQLNLIPALPASVAAQEGRHQVLCELFGASDYGLTAQDMKRIADWLMLFGVNFFVPHCLFYSLDGERKYDAPPSFFTPNPLWDIFPFWTDHVRKTAARLGPKGVRVDIAIIRPMWLLAGHVNTESARPLHEKAMHLCERLLQRGQMFHFLDDSNLEEVTCRDGRSVFRKASYRWLIDLSEGECPRTTLALQRLSLKGSQIIKACALDAIPAPLHSASGDIRGVETHTGESFLVNLSPNRQTCLWKDEVYELDGYQSLWTQAPSQQEKRIALPLMGWRVEPPPCNYALLQQWRIDGLPAPLGPLYRTHLSEVGPTITASLGQIPSRPRLRTPSRVSYTTQFKLEEPLTLDLVIEPEAIKGSWIAKIDGIPLHHWRDHFYYERFNQVCCIGPLDAGWHQLEIELEASKATDGLLDIVRLAGNFAVKTSLHEAGNPVLTKRRQCIDPDDWAASGYPHYSGSMVYSIQWDNFLESWQSVFLQADRPLPGHATVVVNGTPAGCLAWAPWRLEIGPLLRPGANTIELKVSNSLTHLIYGRSGPTGLGASLLSLQIVSGLE